MASQFGEAGFTAFNSRTFLVVDIFVEQAALGLEDNEEALGAVLEHEYSPVEDLRAKGVETQRQPNRLE